MTEESGAPASGPSKHKVLNLDLLMGPKATAQTSIGTVYLYSLRASDISEFRKLRADDPAERVREFLPCIASLSERSSFKEEREPLPTELAAQLTEADLDALGTAYASPTVLGAAREYHQCSLSERVGTTWKSACKPAQHLKYSVIRTVFNQITLWVRARLELGDSYSGAFAIFSNPPFRLGVQHALKAWDILWDGEIVAILNAESLRNAFSNDRQRLLQLIAKHGEVEFIADAFKGEDVEREADVEVALVYLRKEANLENDIFGNMLDGLDQDDESAQRIAAEFQQRHDIALPASFIENRVSTFDAAVRAMKAAVFAEANASHYETLLGQTMAERIDRRAVDPAKTTDYVLGEVETRYAKLKDAAWSGILRSSNVTSRLSSKAQKRVESEFEHIKKLDFSVKTIYGFLTGIVESRGQIQLDMAFDVFHSITEYWSDNTVFFKGWKSNDKHRTCGFRIKTTRFVLPRNGTWCRELDWDAMQRLRDFDKVFAMLDGKVTPEVSLEELFTKHFNALCHGERLSGSYFDVRYYPGAQTIHFFPNKKLNLVDRLNRLVGKHRQWLPPSDDDVTVNFWQGYDKAEKMNEDMQRKIKKGWYGDSPIKTLMHSRNEKERQAAVDRIVPAIEETMRENKISPIFLTLENKSPQMLLLEAA